MSTKSSIFLTKDNEHCYYETSEYVGYDRNPIILEIDLKHAEIISFPDDKEAIIIQFNDPDSDIYRIFASLGYPNETVSDIEKETITDRLTKDLNKAKSLRNEPITWDGQKKMVERRIEWIERRLKAESE